MPHPSPDPARRALLLGAGGLLAAGVAPQSHAQRTTRPMNRCCPVVELRQYTLHAGRREELITLFEREFIESQAAVGARVIGQFRDLDDPDRFVWLRGFADMAARRGALEAFYGGLVWQAHRGAANPTMLDSDNVLLLRPAAPEGGFDVPAPRSGTSSAVFTAAIHYLDEALVPAFAAFFEARLRPPIEADGAPVLASFVTETSANSFPRLPVRSTDRVFVWFSRFESQAAEADFRARHGRRSGWRDGAPEALLPAFARKPEWLRLAPTPRSALR
jgi:hypothetical protein